MRIRLLPEAKQELFESFEWYEREQAGTGWRFLEYVQKTPNAVKQDPKRFPIVGKTIRKAVMDVFPFLLYFEIISEDDEEIVVILSVFHGKRKPIDWGGGE